MAQVISPSVLGLSGIDDFGRSMTVSDFNGDGLPDLAIGAAGNGSTRGRVVVLRGRASSPWVRTNGFAALTSDISAGPTAPDEFGAALAAGNLARGRTGPLLAIGAPGHDGDDGAVCTVGFTGATGTMTVDSANFPVDCRENPFPQSGSDQQRFGAAVAVDNFTPWNATGSSTTPEALVEELAVGTPKGREVKVVQAGTSTELETPYFSVDYSETLVEYGDASSVQSGSVMIFRSSEYGPRMFVPPGTGGTTVWATHAQQMVPSSRTGSDLFGSSLSVANLQDNAFPDLLVGMLGRGDGEYVLTRSTPSNGLEGGMSGSYEVFDSLGNSRTALVLEQEAGLVSIQIGTFLVRVEEDGDGALCSVGGFSGQATTSIGTPFFEFSDTDTSPVSFTLEFPSSIGVSGMTVDGEIVFDDPDIIITLDKEPKVSGSDPWGGVECLVKNSPFRLEFDNNVVCE